MKPTAISFAAFCTAGQKLSATVSRKIEESRLWCDSNGYQLEETDGDTGVLATVTHSGEHLACLQLLLARVRDGSIAPGVALILDSLGPFSEVDIKRALIVFMELAQQGIPIVTPRDNMVWAAEALQDMGGFFFSVAAMYALDREKVLQAERSAARRKHRARQAALLAEQKAA